MKFPILNYVSRPHIRRRLWRERLTEPIHLNLVSLFVALFGSTRSKIEYDCIPMQHYAFGLAKASEIALECGVQGITVIEFGVAAGRGLMNLYSICELLSRETSLDYHIYGFDSGHGMPPPIDFRDHPDLYSKGDFPMGALMLQSSLPKNVHLVLGNVSDTVETFMEELPATHPIGFVSFDLDYYSSTMSAFKLLTDKNSAKYLPRVPVYFDDIAEESHNPWAGELLAIKHYNDQSENRKLSEMRFLKNARIFKNAWWLNQMYFFHVLDHERRSVEGSTNSPTRHMDSPFTVQK